MEHKKDEKVRKIYRIRGMHCGGCAKTVEHKLTALPEVVDVKVDLATKQASVTSTGAIAPGKLQEALSGSSYSIVEM